MVHMAKEQKKRLRAQFRDQVIGRDMACKICGSIEALEAHHITDRNEMPNGGYVAANGISLCPEHHAEIEERTAVETSGETVRGLYEMIGSSYALALVRSDLLGRG